MYTGLPLMPAITPLRSRSIPLSRARMKLLSGEVLRSTPRTSAWKVSGVEPVHTDRP